MLIKHPWGNVEEIHRKRIQSAKRTIGLVPTCGNQQFIEPLNLWQLREGREWQACGKLSMKRCSLGRILRKSHEIKEQKLGKGPALYEDVGQGKVWSVGARSDVAACRTQYLEGREDVRGAG